MRRTASSASKPRRTERFLYTERLVSLHKPAIVIEDRTVVPGAALDHAGYREWVKSDEYPERARTTFVAGQVLVEMTPESLENHNKLKTAITVALATFVGERDLGEAYSDGTLVTNEAAGLSCEPDFTFVSWSTFEANRVRLIRRVDDSDNIELLGSPDLVVEVVSDSSVRKDTRLLREAYARATVREYWLIDARGADIKFQILSNAGGTFASRSATSAPQQSAVLPGAWRLARGLNRAGRFTYSLTRT